MVSHPLPHAWLQNFITWEAQCARHNAFNQFELHRAKFDSLAQISLHLHNASQQIGAGPVQYHQTSVLQSGRAEKVFNLAAQLALEGRIFESWVMNRSVLECAVYALVMRFDKSAEEAWAKRHDDAAALKRCRTIFSHRCLQQAVQRHAARVAKPFDEMYELAIDFGAHPNRHGILRGGGPVGVADGIQIQTWLLTKDSQEIAGALDAVGKAGAIALSMILSASEDRNIDTPLGQFATELLHTFGC